MIQIFKSLQEAHTAYMAMSGTRWMYKHDTLIGHWIISDVKPPDTTPKSFRKENHGPMRPEGILVIPPKAPEEIVLGMIAEADAFEALIQHDRPKNLPEMEAPFDCDECVIEAKKTAKARRTRSINSIFQDRLEFCQKCFGQAEDVCHCNKMDEIYSGA